MHNLSLCRLLVSIAIATLITAMTSPPLLQGKLNSATSTLPKAMTSDIPGSWAYDTMKRRILADILPRIIEDNAEELTQPSHPANSEAFLLINDLKSSLECGEGGILRGLADKGPDLAAWDAILRDVPEERRNWLQAPWVVSEFYFYRRVAECFRFFETGYDMFKKQKAAGLVEALGSIDEIAARLPALLAADRTEAVTVAVLTSLWGNKMDLSLWPAASAGQTISFGAALEASRPFVLDDHSPAVVARLTAADAGSGQGSGQRVDIVVDNAGYELVSDLILGHSLLATDSCTQVVFHTKGHPTFVSDATTRDCLETIGFLRDSSREHTAALATALAAHVDAGRFVFSEDLFWCQPTAFWDSPPHIQERFRGSKMVFVKGDANYRRLLGEREWPLETSARDVLSYWPVPVCALRTFKVTLTPNPEPRTPKPYALTPNPYANPTPNPLPRCEH